MFFAPRGSNKIFWSGGGSLPESARRGDPFAPCQVPVLLRGGEGKGQGWTNPRSLLQTLTTYRPVPSPPLSPRSGSCLPQPRAVAHRVPQLPEGWSREVEAHIRETQGLDLSAFSAPPPSQNQGPSSDGPLPAPCSLRCPKTSSQHRLALPPGPTHRGLQGTTPTLPGGVGHCRLSLS